MTQAMNLRSLRLALLVLGLPLAIYTQTGCQSQQEEQEPQVIKVPGLTCQPGEIKRLVGGTCTCVTNQSGLTPNCT